MAFDAMIFIINYLTIIAGFCNKFSFSSLTGSFRDDLSRLLGFLVNFSNFIRDLWINYNNFRLVNMLFKYCCLRWFDFTVHFYRLTALNDMYIETSNYKCKHHFKWADCIEFHVSCFNTWQFHHLTHPNRSKYGHYMYISTLYLN